MRVFAVSACSDGAAFLGLSPIESDLRIIARPRIIIGKLAANAVRTSTDLAREAAYPFQSLNCAILLAHTPALQASLRRHDFGDDSLFKISDTGGFRVLGLTVGGR